MTQFPTLGSDAPEATEQRFELLIYRPDGSDAVPRRLDSYTPEGVGLTQEIDSVVQGGACKRLTFSGRRDLVQCVGGEIVRPPAEDLFR